MDSSEIKNIFAFDVMKLLANKEYEEASNNLKDLLKRIKEEKNETEYNKQVKRLVIAIRGFFIKKGQEDIPPELQSFFIDVAEIFIDNGSYEAAEDIIKSAVSITRNKEKIQKSMVNYASHEINILGKELVRILSLKTGKDPEQVCKELNNLPADTKNALGVSEDPEETSIFAFYAVTAEVDRTSANKAVMEQSQTGETRTSNNENPTQKPCKTKLPAFLLPHERWIFFDKVFPNAKIREYTDFWCFIDEETNLVIMEKFLTKDAEGHKHITENTDATYIVPIEHAFNLLSKSEFKNLKKQGELIKTLHHIRRKDLSDEEIEEYFPQPPKYYVNRKFVPENIQDIPYERINYYRNIMLYFNEVCVAKGLPPRFPEVEPANTKNSQGKTIQKGKTPTSNEEATEVSNNSERKQLTQEINRLVKRAGELNRLLKEQKECTDEMRRHKEELVEVDRKIAEYLGIGEK